MTWTNDDEEPGAPRRYHVTDTSRKKLKLPLQPKRSLEPLSDDGVYRSLEAKLLSNGDSLRLVIQGEFNQNTCDCSDDHRPYCPIRYWAT